MRAIVRFFSYFFYETIVIIGDESRLSIGEKCGVANTMFNTSSGKIEVGDRSIFSHNVMVITGRHLFKDGVRASLNPEYIGQDLGIGGGDVEELFEKLSELNCGEIIFNSIDQDGTGFGSNFDFLELKPQSFDLPVIISGGFGKPHHFEEALYRGDLEAVSTSNILNFIGDSFKNARNILMENQVPLGKW